ncbi:MAG: DUF1501 domain-containing protein [Bacteroidota bacterium]|nr:DUF1501 domain-containing protein [Bacteroidota bacterium]
MSNLNDKTGLTATTIGRRDFLRMGAFTIGGLALGNFLSLRAAQPNKLALAKSVIYIYLDGGPCHIDTFDPKPKAGKDYCGPYKTPINTNVDGIQIGEKLTRLAKIADKYSIIRSMTHNYFGHETASYAVQTGTHPGGQLVYPSMGAVVAYKKQQEYTGSLPPYISVTSSNSRFNEAGFLGPQYKSFATGGEPEKDNFIVEGIVNNNITDQQINNRRELLHSLDTFEQELAQDAEIKKMDSFRDKAYSLILGDAKKAFDIHAEDDKTRTRYGRTRFGQSCLLARRMVERGVPFVTVRSVGWDTHKQHFERMDEMLPDLDQGLSALIEDLSARGLLQDTIVICGGEFGRTPKILWEPPWNGGRGHFATAFSYLVAGGGFIGGKMVGATDFKGEEVIERPVYPWDLIASIYQLLGIDPTGTLPHPRDGFARVLPDFKNTTQPGNGILREIMKTV